MTQKPLSDELEHLHRELSEAPSLDAEARALLAELAADIERLLAEDAPESTGPLADRLSAATERFEETHPKLTAVIGRLADALANLGI
ncbi:MAG: DUF4404 family protein [Deltaproteobacteria bacterium]|nr:DUF4404 family protein [Deltaproteobacteria bacterium]MBW2360659.1 DUF4404 family protein [Deltaproteobacteria bacterium]